MQVLMKSKVKFVSAFGVHLLTSLWMLLVLSQLHVFLPYSWWGKRPLLVVVKPAGTVLQIFLALTGSGGLGFGFPLWWLGKAGGLSLGYSNHRYPVSSPRPQSTVWCAVSTLCSCTGLALINHLTLHPFDHL